MGGILWVTFGESAAAHGSVRFRDSAFPRANTAARCGDRTRFCNSRRDNPLCKSGMDGTVLPCADRLAPGIPPAVAVGWEPLLRNLRGYRSCPGQSRPQTAHLWWHRCRRAGGGDPRTPRTQAGRAARGPRLSLDRLGPKRAARHRGAGPRNPGAGAHPLHLRDHRGSGREAPGRTGAGSPSGDGAARAQQSRCAARGSGIGAAAHGRPGRSGEPPDQPRNPAPESRGGSSRGQGRVPGRQAQRRSGPGSRHQGVDLGDGGQPGHRSGRRAGDAVPGRGEASGRHGRRLRLAARPAACPGRSSRCRDRLPARPGALDEGDGGCQRHSPGTCRSRWASGPSRARRWHVWWSPAS